MIKTNFLTNLTLDQLEERAYLNMQRGIRVSPELRAEIDARKKSSLTRADAARMLSLRVRALVEDGNSPVEALRMVCGAAVVDSMIDTLYNELRAKR